jgi:hypothetical protein
MSALPPIIGWQHDGKSDTLQKPYAHRCAISGIGRDPKVWSV